MAASMKNIFQPVSRLLLRKNPGLSVVCTRGSVYDQSYLETSKTLEEIKRPLAEDDIRRFRKIKAANTDDNTFADSDVVVGKLINMITKCGRKEVARDIVMKALEYVKRVQVEKYHKASDEEKTLIVLDPVKILHQAIENGKPLLITCRVTMSGQKHLVPIAPSERRQNFLSLKWLVSAGGDKPHRVRFHDKLGQEILNAFNEEGGLIQRKQEMHKICEAHKAYAHLK
ncbi:28S ribosomal protein S7 [Mactra antiquata]